MDGQFLKPRIVRNDRLARTRVKAHERMSESVKSIDLSRAGPGEFRRTRSKFVEIIWMVCEAIFVSNPLQISHKLRAAVLRLFGAKIGRGVFHGTWKWAIIVGWESAPGSITRIR